MRWLHAKPRERLCYRAEALLRRSGDWESRGAALRALHFLKRECPDEVFGTYPAPIAIVSGQFTPVMLSHREINGCVIAIRWFELDHPLFLEVGFVDNFVRWRFRIGPDIDGGASDDPDLPAPIADRLAWLVAVVQTEARG